jgi:hypothetical protein
VINGKVVDVHVSATSSYVGKGVKNGVIGTLGRLNVKAGTSVTVDIQILESATGNVAVVDGMSITFLDLDEGKKGKGRASVTLCGAEQFVSDPSELTLTSSNAGRCSTATSSVAGTGADNPSSVEAALASDVASKRIVSYVFASGNSFSATLDVAKGHGFRNFMFAFSPGAACTDDLNMPSACAAVLAAEEDVVPVA